MSRADERLSIARSVEDGVDQAGLDAADRFVLASELRRPSITAYIMKVLSPTGRLQIPKLSPTYYGTGATDQSLPEYNLHLKWRTLLVGVERYANLNVLRKKEKRVDERVTIVALRASIMRGWFFSR